VAELSARSPKSEKQQRAPSPSPVTTAAPSEQGREHEDSSAREPFCRQPAKTDRSFVALITCRLTLGRKRSLPTFALFTGAREPGLRPAWRGEKKAGAITAGGKRWPHCAQARPPEQGCRGRVRIKPPRACFLKHGPLTTRPRERREELGARTRLPAAAASQAVPRLRVRDPLTPHHGLHHGGLRINTRQARSTQEARHQAGVITARTK